MKKYYEGNAKHYYVGVRKEVNGKQVFNIMAETAMLGVAMFIRDSYRDAYARTGIDLKPELFKGDELPKQSIFPEGSHC